MSTGHRAGELAKHSTRQRSSSSRPRWLGGRIWPGPTQTSARYLAMGAATRLERSALQRSADVNSRAGPAARGDGETLAMSVLHGGVCGSCLGGAHGGERIATRSWCRASRATRSTKLHRQWLDGMVTVLRQKLGFDRASHRAVESTGRRRTLSMLST
jgi:hypothetical protein